MTAPFTLHNGDCLEVMRTMADNSVDAIVCDPPYGLSSEPDMAEVLRHWLAGDDYRHKGSGFMGKTWDSFVPGPPVWREALRVLKPGGHLLAFFGSRTYDMGTLAIRLAGFEVRDQILWVYGSGFPKSLDVSKAIDKAAGAEREVVGVKNVGLGNGRGAGFRHDGDTSGVPVTAPATDGARQWDGWGTALKPAHEPICVARKPLIGTVVANVLTYGTGAINIDGCRVGTDEELRGTGQPPMQFGGQNTRPFHSRDGEASADRRYQSAGGTNFAMKPGPRGGDPDGRWPANLIHDGSAEVVALFPAQAGASAPVRGTEASAASVGRVTGERERVAGVFHGDKGSAARFFYCAKASGRDRNEGVNTEPVPFVQFQTGNGASGKASSLSEGRDTRHSNTHPTVKPTDLMAYLVRLVTPPGGLVLDPFMGSGSTGKAAMREGFRFVGIELDVEYLSIARARIEFEHARVTKAKAPEPIKVQPKAKPEAASKPVETKAPAPQMDLFAALTAATSDGGAHAA